MTASQLMLASVLLAASSAALADNAGTIKRQGKAATMTAIYVQPVANTDVIVFSDSDKATRYVEGKARSSYTSIDGVFDAETIFRDLAEHGAHPVELTIASGALGDLSMIAAKGAAPTHLHGDKAKLSVVRENEERVEGKLSYDDKSLSLELSFSLQKGRYQLGITETSTPAAPPEPPEPENLPGQMMLATGMLRYSLQQYYLAHDHTWPSSFAQAGFTEDRLPSKIQSRTLGSGGVVTATFRANLPEVGGKSIVMTPRVDADGAVEWVCSAADVPQDAFPLDCTAQ